MELVKCTNCKIDKSKDLFYKDSSKKYGVSSWCKECSKEYKSKNSHVKNQWNKNNKDKVSAHRKKYYQNNKDKIMEYKRNRRNNNSFYRLKENLRSRARNEFSKRQWVKYDTNESLLCADYETVYDHIESLFTEGMNWHKVGREIHIDHIIPLSYANNENELKKLLHYKNLQPLWAKDNLSKGSKIDDKFGNNNGSSLVFTSLGA